MKESSMNWFEMDIIMLSINRRALNYLSTCRTCLNHTECFLKHEFGREIE